MVSNEQGLICNNKDMTVGFFLLSAAEMCFSLPFLAHFPPSVLQKRRNYFGLLLKAWAERISCLFQLI